MIPILISFCLLFHDQNTFCPTLSLKFGASLSSSWPPPEMDGHWSAQLRIFLKRNTGTLKLLRIHFCRAIDRQFYHWQMVVFDYFISISLFRKKKFKKELPEIIKTTGMVF